MILCCGEALIDMIPNAVSDGQNGFVPHSGGAVFNTSIALGRLDEHVGLLTGLSSDMFGDQLRQGLAASNVDASYCIQSDRPSTLAFVKLTDGQAQYSFFDENSAGRMIRTGDMPQLPETISALFFGGISLACEPGAQAYETLALTAGKSRAVMIDPNIRPSFIEDEDAYRTRLDRMIAVADIVKVSDEDLDWIVAGASNLATKAKDILAKGPALVIVTQGKDGAIGILPTGEMIEVPAKPVKVVDTIGAGDTFNAGVLAKLSQFGVLSKEGLRMLTPDTVKQALIFGGEVAALTVSRAGANPPWANEL